MINLSAYGRVYGNIKTGIHEREGNTITVVSFVFVASARHTNKDGEKEKLIFRVTIFGKLADALSETIYVGMPLIITGEIYGSEYVDKKGIKRFYNQISPHNVTIDFLETKETSLSKKEKKEASTPQPNGEQAFAFEGIEFEDDLPF